MANLDDRWDAVTDALRTLKESLGKRLEELRELNRMELKPPMRPDPKEGADD